MLDGLAKGQRSSSSAFHNPYKASSCFVPSLWFSNVKSARNPNLRHCPDSDRRRNRSACRWRSSRRVLFPCEGDGRRYLFTAPRTSGGACQCHASHFYRELRFPLKLSSARMHLLCSAGPSCSWHQLCGRGSGVPLLANNEKKNARTVNPSVPPRAVIPVKGKSVSP